MRQNKIKAWDKKGKKWIKEFYISNDGKKIVFSKDKEQFELLVGQDVELVGYAEEKDVNGKEMF